jgi:hypothetical protein
MRRYDVVSGILFILFIIDSALAAPVVQEQRRAFVDVAHIPKDVIIVGKRGDEWLEEFVDDLKETENESSDAHGSPSSTPPGSDRGSTNVVQAPAPNPASSTASPDPSMGPPGPSSTVPMQGSWEDRFIIMRHG